LRCRDGIAGAYDELIPVRRKHCHGQAQRIARLIECRSGDFVHSDPAVLRQVEEFSLYCVRSSHSDPVAICDLLETKGASQVGNSALPDVVRLDKAVRTLGP
jgi:hypothetical protein